MATTRDAAGRSRRAKVQVAGRQPLLVSRPRQRWRSRHADGRVSGKVTPRSTRQARRGAGQGHRQAGRREKTSGQLLDYSVKPDGRLDIALDGKHYLCDLKGRQLRPTWPKLVKTGSEPGVLSPDKKSEAFIRDWNLWLRDVASGKETQLTTDGVENSATPPTTPAGSTPTTRSSCGRPIRNRSPRSSRTSARPATCIWSAPMSVIRSWTRGNIRWSATRT
jgi:hypothetical protein